MTARGGVFHYLRNVLRVELGMKLKAFDGSGAEHLCRVEEIASGSIELSIIDTLSPDYESPLDITLALGVSKPKSFELSVQKATELGVKKIVPVLTRRSMPGFSGQKAARYEKIAVEAARQCGRSFVPTIAAPEDFGVVIGKAQDFGLSIMPWEEEEEVKIGTVIENNKSGNALVLIGPEGGFTTDEAERAKSAGVATVSLGPRILRAETAALAVISMLVYSFELR